jgi:hypothetical protein
MDDVCGTPMRLEHRTPPNGAWNTFWIEKDFVNDLMERPVELTDKAMQAMA